jgi:hypothetical protein
MASPQSDLSEKRSPKNILITFNVFGGEGSVRARTEMVNLVGVQGTLHGIEFKPETYGKYFED